MVIMWFDVGSKTKTTTLTSNVNGWKNKKESLHFTALICFCDLNHILIFLIIYTLISLFPYKIIKSFFISRKYEEMKDMLQMKKRSSVKQVAC